MRDETKDDVAALKARIEVYAKAVDQRDDIIQTLSAGLQEAIDYLKWRGGDAHLSQLIARLTAILETGETAESGEPRKPLRFDCPPVDVLRQMHPLPELGEVMDRNDRAIAKTGEATAPPKKYTRLSDIQTEADAVAAVAQITDAEFDAAMEAVIASGVTDDPHDIRDISCTACGRQHLATEACDPWAVAYRANIPVADVPEWAVHVATDGSGEVWAYRLEPGNMGMIWYAFGPRDEEKLVKRLGMVSATGWPKSLRKVEDVWPERKRNQGKDGGE